MYGITQARCDMVLDVSAEGLPENIEPVCTHAMFEEAALMAARKWRFEPAMLDGVAVATRTLVAPIIFLTEDYETLTDNE
jgi:TonB family protein